MDESAEWRRMYDHEHDRANKCRSDLNKVSIPGLRFHEFDGNFSSLH